MTNSNDMEAKLELYALFKQAKNGDASILNNTDVEMEENIQSAKRTAWESKRGISQFQAMQLYVDLVEQM